MHKMPILHRDICYILVGRILLFVWNAHFYVGMSTLIVKTGRISLFAWDAYFHSGMPIFTVKLGTRVPIYLRKYWHRGGYFFVKFGIRDAYFWGCLFSLDIGTARCAITLTSM